MVRPSSVFTEVGAGHGRVEELSALVVVESRRYNKKKQTENVVI